MVIQVNGDELGRLLDYYEEQLEDEKADRQLLLESLIETLRKATAIAKESA